MRLIDRIIVFGVLLWIGGMLFGRVAEEFTGAATPPPPAEAGLLPRAEPRTDDLPDLSRGRVSDLAVELPRRGSRHVGSAWQVGDGVWLSARHVVQNCDMERLGGNRSPRVAQRWRHPDADLAAFRTTTAPPPLAFAARPPALGDRSVAIGFPSGEAGVARLRLLGAVRMRLAGAYDSERPFRALVWQVETYPAHIEPGTSLGGISGGTVLDAAGNAVGVAFAGADRRGLLMSVGYAASRAARDATVARPPPAARGRADPDALLAAGTVSRVLCRS